ncbi:MAG: hypothetical protein NVV72_20000 [Asticcacaulis sp.]|nr:hypothetical protein [Asticcacaulis sp.]
MIEHMPWVGPLYDSEGLKGQRLGIMGYSAWTPEDHAGYTIESIANVVSGAWPKVQFFNAIPNYFDWDRADFYNRVTFFEFVPCAIGGGDQRYAVATPEQSDAGRKRVLSIAEAHKMDKLLVFSAKGWSALTGIPGMCVEEQAPLGDTGFHFARCQVGDRMLTVIGLRHPQYAPARKMREAVNQVLAL